jgi:hypothetical protein
VEVLQLLQLSAPTTGGRIFLELVEGVPELELASLLLSFASVSLASATAAAALRFKSPREFVFTSPDSGVGAGSEGEAALRSEDMVAAAVDRALL